MIRLLAHAFLLTLAAAGVSVLPWWAGASAVAVAAALAVRRAGPRR
jgi:hypothetical protein